MIVCSEGLYGARAGDFTPGNASRKVIETCVELLPNTGDDITWNAKELA